VGFKSDREFLRNVSIGAVGTQKVAALLNAGGFRTIELERYCTCNKIWATKIKRLRVPDLLCLKTGIRIECRAKSVLKLTMSHAVNNAERAWDKGLRDEDLVAFIQCTPQDDGWRPADRVNLFLVGDMRRRAHLAGLGRVKAASEGSEIQLTWPATVPTAAGRIEAVTPERISAVLNSGRRQTYQLRRKELTLSAHAKPGETFEPRDTIIASVMPMLVEPVVPVQAQYDFVADLDSNDKGAVYAAVKALGFLPKLAKGASRRLESIAKDSEDIRVRLEASASLARLGNDAGWQSLAAVARDSGAMPEHRMEVALIVGELPSEDAANLLDELADTSGNPTELRAAAVWSLAAMPAGRAQSVLSYVDDDDEMTAVHAIVAGSKLITDQNLEAVLAGIGDQRRSAGIIRAVLRADCDAVPIVVRSLHAAEGERRSWLLYLLAANGRDACESHLRANAPDLLSQLDFFWVHQVENWTNRLDVADQIDFLAQQNIR
jgi:hypothetical protein